MENALLIGLSRQVALSRELEVIANNVANMNTTGFKARSLRFEEYIMPTASADAFMMNTDKPLSYVVDKGSGLDFAGGGVEVTNNPLDIAVKGDGVIAVRTPQGERYTRNGQLQVNTRGELVTSDGYPVIGDSGPIAFDITESNISIGKDGTVSSSQGQKGRIKLMEVRNPGQLENAGANLYSATTPLAAAGPAISVQSGAIEKSNVKPVIEMSRLIEVNRAYSTIATILQRNDELTRSAVERLAAVPA